MRDIKFRAWDGKKMVYDIIKHSIIHHELSGMGGDVRDFSDWVEFYHTMQYTGLKDKNDKEIYEGDILRRKDNIGKVWWDGGGSWLWGLYADTLGDYPDSLEIIGNIHENPNYLIEYSYSVR